LFPENETKKDVPNCVTSGVLGVLPNTLGMFQATEVLKIILGIGEVLSGKLLLYNALNCQTQLIDFNKNEVEIEKGIKNGNELVINLKSAEVDLVGNQFFDKVNNPNCVLIDIREWHEQPRLSFENLLEIPLNDLENQIENINKNQEVILCCQSGKRSQFALAFFKQKGFTNVFHLKNGIQSLEIKPLRV
jgi:adenylyltransferase/sulfurtransferase